MADPVKRIMLFRHSLKGTGDFKNVISPEGMVYAHRVGAQALRGRGIARVFVSPMMRTTQTAIALLEGAGDFTGMMGPTVKNLIGMPVAEWARRYPSGNESLEEMKRIDPIFIGAISLILLVVAKEIIDETPVGGRSLVVGHTPGMEIMIEAITKSAKKNPNGITIKPLAPCEGVFLLVWEDGLITVEREIRHNS